MMRAQTPDELTTPLALECPECRGPVANTDKTCPTCGVDLGLATLLAEHGIWASVPSVQLTPLAEQLVLPRFGEFLLKNNFIAESQLQAALAQQQAASRERPLPLGQILLEMGVVTREQLDVAAIQQVRQLQEMLIEDNRQLQRHVNNYVQELWQALRKLDELNQLKSNFLANIRHELRTPLSNIKGYIELLAHGYIGEISAEQKEALAVVSQAAAHLEQLINDLIRFASSAKGELALEQSSFLLDDLATRLLGNIGAKAAAGEVTLKIEIPPALPPVLGDQEKIYWVLFHLLENAIKFTPAGGEVRLTAAPGKRVRLQVRDTGIGIPPDRIREIFEPFHQLDGSSTRAYGGLGLGLALVRQVVEMHGSQIEVESRPGHGSVFSFDLGVAAA
jgi:signal transduction histidine kinase